MSAQQTAKRGFPSLAILMLIFAAAKVFGFSNMAWLWVFSPVWLPLGLLLGIWFIAVVALVLVAGFGAAASAAADGIRQARSQRR